jgi:mono/diheme cytochrome c family protein
MRPPPEGRAFLILKAVADATERAELAAPASADSYCQSISARSIDGSFESAHCPDDGCRHGAADFECCRYEILGFLCDQPRGTIGRLCSGTAPFAVVFISPAAAKTPAGPSIAAAESSAGASTARGKSIFDSQGCAGCHGESGGGGSGPALTHTSSQYPPAQLKAVLIAPTAQMKAAGMVALNANAADIEALVSYVSSLGGASAASAVKPPSPGLSSAAPARAGPAETGAPLTPVVGNSASTTTAAPGKSIFDSQGCNGCHGEGGSGGTGPALARISSHYSPVQLAAVRKGLTEVLKAPTPQMKAGGMIPLNLNAADMEALVSYVSSFGGASAASASTPPASGSPSAAPATTGPVAAASPSKPESKGSSILRWISVFLPYPHGTPPTEEPSAAIGPSTAPHGSSADAAGAARGKSIFDSQGCAGCHGEGGSGGSGPALTHTSSQYPPAQLMAVLKAPTAKMTAAGMVPLTLNAADMKSLISYMTSLGGESVVSATAPPASLAKSNPQ